MDERRGLVVRRDRGEGCVDESVSSTSNDRFSAGKHRTFVVRQETEEPLSSCRCLCWLELQQQHLYDILLYSLIKRLMIVMQDDKI